MAQRTTSREIAYCGTFGAAALLLPVLFHMVHLGHVFMPMYLPLVALAFFAGPAAAGVTAFVVPLLSGAVTGMPPFYPPIAVLMAIELCLMGVVLAAIRRRWPRSNEWLVLAGVLLFGRVVYVLLGYFFNLWIELPAGFLAGLSILKGWPGVILMMIVVPPLVRAVAPLRGSEPVLGDGDGGDKDGGDKDGGDKDGGDKDGGDKDSSDGDSDDGGLEIDPAANDGTGDDMADDEKAAFFNSIAEKWDGWEDLESLAGKLSAALDRLGVQDDETVVDVGCGTGNLTQALLKKLSPEGRVVAVDIASAMIDVAKRKIPDSRATWHVTDAGRLPIPDVSCDRVFCYSVWPHVDDPDATIAEFTRVLRPGGLIHVWHLISRERVNAIHAGASAAVRHDVLPPAEEIAALFQDRGYSILACEEDESHYLVTARRGE